MAKRPTLAPTSSKLAAIFDAFRKVLGGPMVPLLFPIDPVPASRPRVARWGTYYAPTYKNWMKAAAPFVEACKQEHMDGPLAVLIEVVCPPPKTVKRDYPRGDVDNYEKAALDAITKGETVWDDDDQVVVLLGAKRYTRADEKPHTAVEVYKL